MENEIAPLDERIEGLGRLLNWQGAQVNDPEALQRLMNMLGRLKQQRAALTPPTNS